MYACKQGKEKNSLEQENEYDLFNVKSKFIVNDTIKSSDKVSQINVNLKEVLKEDVFINTPLLTDLISPQKTKLSEQTINVLKNLKGGGQIPFSVIKFSIDDKNYHALQIADNPIYNHNSAEMVYWAPQGGYVDIPKIPSPSEPKFVLTPGFSGCSLVADQLNNEKIRVYHVEGGKENQQYNNLDRTNTLHLNNMRFIDYGIYHDEMFKTNTFSTAFLRFEEEIENWVIYYQSLSNLPVLVSLDENKSCIKLYNNPFTKIVSGDIKILANPFTQKHRIFQAKYSDKITRKYPRTFKLNVSMNIVPS